MKEASENPFIKRFKDKSTPHLKKMIESPSEFQPKAVEATKFILEQRELGIPEFQPTQKVITDTSFKSKDVSRSIFKKINVFYVVAALLIITFLSGIFFLIDNYQSSLNSKLLTIVIAPIFILDALASVLLVMKKTAGIKLSILALIIHSFKFSFFSFEFGISVPVYFYVTLKFFGFLVDIGIDSANITLLFDSNESFISLNLITVFFAIKLIRFLKSEKIIKEFN